jgi:predicted adenylyl cyclase CyaB
MGGSVTLTYKKYVEDPHAKVREELEVMVADLETAKKILENLGFQQKHAIRKHRTSYRLQDARLEFDRHLGEHSFIPEFMEIEGKDAEQLPKVMEKLGLRQEDARDWSFFEVAEHYKARGG